MAAKKQYVNLPAKEGVAERGNKPTLEAKPTSKRGFFSFKRKVDWTVTPGDKNVAPKYVPAAARCKVKDPTTTEADEKFTTELTLPYTGKDTYKVTCKKNAKKEKDQTQLLELEFETWRKIYYSVWLMNQKCKTMFDNIKTKFHAAFEGAGIELEMVGRFDCKQDEESTIMPADAAKYDLPSIYPTGTEAIKDRPFHLKIAFVNDLVEEKEQALDRALTRSKTDKAKNAWVEDLDAAKRPASKGTKSASDLDGLKDPAEGDAYELSENGTPKDGPASKKGDLLVRKSGKWVVHRGKWVAHCKTAELARDGDTWKKELKAKVGSTGAEKTLDAARWEKVSKEEVKIKLHEDADLNAALDRGNKVTLRLKLNVLLNAGCCGYSIGNFVVCRSKDPEVSVLQTFTHEIGHGLQQSRKELKTYKADTGAADGTEANPKWYTDDHGGQGPHCWTNAKEVDSDKTTSGKTYDHDSTKGSLCTLYHADHAKVDADGKFCETCLENLRRTDLSAEAMIAKGWKWYK